ncbi:MAG: hypothetical protein QXP01_06690, partial [Candidatus Hadarchaeum sp.]
MRIHFVKRLALRYNLCLSERDDKSVPARYDGEVLWRFAVLHASWIISIEIHLPVLCVQGEREIMSQPNQS